MYDSCFKIVISLLSLFFFAYKIYYINKIPPYDFVINLEFSQDIIETENTNDSNFNFTMLYAFLNLIYENNSETIKYRKSEIYLSRTEQVYKFLLEINKYENFLESFVNDKIFLCKYIPNICENKNLDEIETNKHKLIAIILFIITNLKYENANYDIKHDVHLLFNRIKYLETIYYNNRFNHAELSYRYLFSFGNGYNILEIIKYIVKMHESQQGMKTNRIFIIIDFEQILTVLIFEKLQQNYQNFSNRILFLFDYIFNIEGNMKGYCELRQYLFSIGSKIEFIYESANFNNILHRIFYKSFSLEIKEKERLNHSFLVQIELIYKILYDYFKTIEFIVNNDDKNYINSADFIYLRRKYDSKYNYKKVERNILTKNTFIDKNKTLVMDFIEFILSYQELSKIQNFLREISSREINENLDKKQKITKKESDIKIVPIKSNTEETLNDSTCQNFTKKVVKSDDFIFIYRIF